MTRSIGQEGVGPSRPDGQGLIAGSSAKKLLVVEDERSLLRLMTLELEHAGFEVDAAVTGQDAIHKARSLFYACVLLDIMLPDISGLEVCRRIRTESDVPIIMITARGQVLDKVAGLDTGADDYLVKPINFEELTARIRAVTRRHEGGLGNGRTLEAGDVVLYRDQHRVTVRDESLTLTPLEFQLLEYLLLHQDWVQTRQTLLDRIWGFRYDGGTNIVDVTVGRLRRRLEQSGSRLAIETVRGVGYVIRSRQPL